MGYFFAFHFALSRHRGSPYGGLRTSRDVYAVAPRTYLQQDDIC